MIEDEVIDEIREIRREFAERNNNELSAMFEELRRREAERTQVDKEDTVNTG